MMLMGLWHGYLTNYMISDNTNFLYNTREFCRRNAIASIKTHPNERSYLKFGILQRERSPSSTAVLGSSIAINHSDRCQSSLGWGDMKNSTHS